MTALMHTKISHGTHLFGYELLLKPACSAYQWFWLNCSAVHSTLIDGKMRQHEAGIR